MYLLKELWYHGCRDHHLSSFLPHGFMQSSATQQSLTHRQTVKLSPELPQAGRGIPGESARSPYHALLQPSQYGTYVRVFTL